MNSLELTDDECNIIPSIFAHNNPDMSKGMDVVLAIIRNKGYQLLEQPMATFTVQFVEELDRLGYKITPKE